MSLSLIRRSLSFLLIIVLIISLQRYVYYLVSSEQSTMSTAMTTRHFTKEHPNEVTSRNERAKKTVLRGVLNVIEDGNSLFPDEKNIFLLETNENVTDFKISLLCAVESAARTNPDFRVVIITASIKTKLPSFLSSYSNVHVHHVNLSSYMESSQLSSLWKSNQVQISKYFFSHLSDLLRYIVVYNYGGIYIDQDVIVTNSFKNASKTFVVPESFGYINAAVFGGAKAHPFLKFVMAKAEKEYNPKVFSCVGPYLMTTATIEYCQKKRRKFYTFINLDCSADIDIFGIGRAYPIPASLSFQLYIPRWTDWALKKAGQKFVLTVHYFSTIRKYWIEKDKTLGNNQVETNQPLYALMHEYCPTTEEKALAPLIGVPWLDRRI